MPVTNIHKNLTLIFIFVLAAIVWHAPVPEELGGQTWHLLVIFLATIVGIILNPLPMGAVAFISILACVLTGTLSLTECLSGFGDSIVWLVVFTFFISNGFIKTGLGARISYYIISKIGSSTLGLSYCLVIADFILSPLIPSVSARGGGIIFPIAKSLCKTFSDQDHPGVSLRTGGFIMSVCAQSNVITSAMFLTAMAANPLAVKLASSAGFEISWIDWMTAAFIPGLASLALMPLVIYYIHPPTIKHSASAPQLAKEKLAEMGKITLNEIIMVAVFFLLIILWMFGNKFGLSATTVALLGLGILFVTHVVHFEDNLADKGAWHIFIWFATLIMLSEQLAKLGFTVWVGNNLQFLFAGTSPLTSLIILSLIYFYIHYLFASATAHIALLFSTFLALLIGAGIPGLVASLILSFLSILSSGLTHFGLASVPIFFGAGYMSTKSWWYIGLVTSILYLLIWGVLGSIWWKILGLW